MGVYFLFLQLFVQVLFVLHSVDNVSVIILGSSKYFANVCNRDNVFFFSGETMLTF